MLTVGVEPLWSVLDGVQCLGKSFQSSRLNSVDVCHTLCAGGFINLVLIGSDRVFPELFVMSTELVPQWENLEGDGLVGCHCDLWCSKLVQWYGGWVKHTLGYVKTFASIVLEIPFASSNPDRIDCGRFSKVESEISFDKSISRGRPVPDGNGMMRGTLTKAPSSGITRSSGKSFPFGPDALLGQILSVVQHRKV